jgi:hypothetical protein
VNDAEEFLRRQWQGARDFFTDVVLTVKQRSLGGSATAIERFVITAPVPQTSRVHIDRLKSIYVAQGHTPDAALHYAALALAAFERFPRNWPTLGRPIETLAPRAKLFDAPSPALHALVSMLWMFPPAGRPADIGDDDLTSRVDLVDNGSSLRLTVTVKRRATSVANLPLA